MILQEFLQRHEATMGSMVTQVSPSSKCGAILGTAALERIKMTAASTLQVFRQTDRDHNGVLSKAEYMTFMRKDLLFLEKQVL